MKIYERDAYRADIAIRSSSSLFATAALSISPRDALSISSARQSWIAFRDLKEAEVAPTQMFRRAMSSRRDGDTSTALGTDIPPKRSRVISSRGAAFSSAFTRTCTGFSFVRSAIVSNARRTTRIAFAFFPVYSSDRIIPLISRSTMLYFAFPKGLFAHRPPVWGITIAVRLMYRASPGSCTTTSESSYRSKSFSSYVYFFFGRLGSFFTFAAGSGGTPSGPGGAGGISIGGGGGGSSAAGGGVVLSGDFGAGVSSSMYLTGRASPSALSRAPRERRR